MSHLEPACRKPFPVVASTVASLACLCLIGAGCQTTTVEKSHYQISDGKMGSVLDSRIKQLEEETQKYPLRADLWYQIAAVHYQKSDFHGSVGALEKAIAISPEEGKYHYQLGRVYLNMGDNPAAEKSFRTAVSLVGGERYTGPYAALGWTLSLKKDFDGAIEQFQKCKELEPENLTYEYFLGSLYDMKGEKEPAIQHFQEYLSRGGDTYRTKAISILKTLGVQVEEAEEAAASAAPPKQETAPIPGAPFEPQNG